LDVADYGGMWVTMATGYASSAQAMKDVKGLAHCDNPGHWAWNISDTKMYKRYNYHKDCPVMVRAVKNPDTTTWRQEVLDVSHALEPKHYRSARSPFTFEEEVDLKKSVNNGMKPHRIRDDATLNAIGAGCIKKNEEGGLIGDDTDAIQYKHDT